MKESYLMECLHLVTIPTNKKGTQVTPICERCNNDNVICKIRKVTDLLEGRYAICGNRKVKSRWDLPGFVFRPDDKYDLFFNGDKTKVIEPDKIKYKSTIYRDEVIYKK